MTAVVLVLVLALVFIGFVASLAGSAMSVNLGTIAVDVLYGLLAAVAVSRGFDRRAIWRFRVPLAFFFAFAAWCAGLTVWGDGPLFQRLMGFRNNVVYPGIWLTLALSCRPPDLGKVLRTVLAVGVVLCAFSIAQGLFYERLPEWCLSYAFKEGKAILRMDNLTVFRVTGLVGNTIVFSGFAGFMVLLGYARLRSLPRGGWAYAALAVSVVALLLSFSRMANFALVAAWGCAWCVWRITSLRRLIAKALVVLALLGVTSGNFLGLLSPSTGGGSAEPRNPPFTVAARLMGSDGPEAASTREHFELLRLGTTWLSRHPWTGCGIGSQGYSSRAEAGRLGMVTDGYWVAQALEVGLPGLGLWLAFLVSVLSILIRAAVATADGHIRWAAATVCFSALYYGVCGVFNSAYWARTNQCLLWLLAGCALAAWHRGQSVKSGCRWVIDGLPFTRRGTGLERFAVETVQALDEIVPEGWCELVVPAWTDMTPPLRNIRTVRCGFLRSALWEQVCLPFHAFAAGAHVLGLCNVVPLVRPGSVCIHDVFYKTHADAFVGVHGFLSKAWHRFQYVWCALFARRIFTVSEFSKREIVREYHVDPKRISVLGNGWEHMRRIESDESVFADFPQLIRNSYFLVLGSLNRYKNVEWVLRSAAAHPGAVYVIVGGDMASSPVARERRENLVFTGYLSDGKVKALMANCRALVFPSLAEGFGIPPLEALSLGRPVIAAKASCLPEIYGNAVHWIENPADCSETDPEALLRSSVTPASDVLSRHSWTKVAETLRSEMEDA